MLAGKRTCKRLGKLDASLRDARASRHLHGQLTMVPGFRRALPFTFSSVCGWVPRVPQSIHHRSTEPRGLFCGLTYGTGTCNSCAVSR
jgi:hypothetical protein